MPDRLPLKIRARDVEIDVLLAEAQRLTEQLQATMARIRETVRTHQKTDPGDE